jgi:hypothetical protein
MPESQPFPVTPGFPSDKLSRSEPTFDGQNQRRKEIIDVQKVLDDLKNFGAISSREDEI